ncbi:preprotein translocase subunit YajC [Actinomyces sp. 432]|nr:preprotein translocase subunit YajC [Actinomyces sp. 594]NDR54699.1 preprotein translocase subunit YajC [Actinomyces sp. 565]QHO92209.1 preprotein translocase subunit YajC [Actinomyces sp. 432]
MLLILIVMLLAFWLMSRFARKQQERMLDEQRRRTEEALVPGTWVRTRAGFYGTVVEVDGDVVTLATPLGDESLWAKNAVVGAEEPPFASAEEDTADDAAGEFEDEPGDPDAVHEAAATGAEDSAAPGRDGHPEEPQPQA